MSITFEVLDLSCEQVDQSFFVPQIRIETKSTTQYATLYGFNEFIASTPPKKYRKCTPSGASLRIGFTAEEVPRQCAGAKYTWTGVSEYDLHGVLTSSYSKKLFAQCSKAYWPTIPLQLNPIAHQPPESTFIGYCWPADLASCQVCSSNDSDWPLLGDITTNSPQLDSHAFVVPANTAVVTSTSYSVSTQFTGIVGLSSPNHFSVAGPSYQVAVGAIDYPAQVSVNEPPLVFPTVYVNGFEAAYIIYTDISNFSFILSEEYTDADALTNATVQLGTGATAQTTPRTTGFTSVFTSVVFTMFMSNLIDGKDYLVTVDMWDKGASPVSSTHTPKQYGFTASGTTHQITDVVATPAPFHTITVQKPTITFSPPP